VLALLYCILFSVCVPCAPFNEGRPLFFGVAGLVVAGAAAVVDLTLAARGGSFAKRLGRAVAAVSAIGLRALLDAGSPSAPVEARFLGGIAKSHKVRWIDGDALILWAN
jgi:hypothetical protein